MTEGYLDPLVSLAFARHAVPRGGTREGPLEVGNDGAVLITLRPR
jgi:hypothetical protein